MKVLITIVCSLAVGLSFGANIPFDDFPFGNLSRNDPFDDFPKPSTLLRGAGSFSCNANEYDRDQHCRCNPGQRIKVFNSKHDNGKEDRKWELQCAQIPGGPNYDSMDIETFVSPYGIATEDQEFDAQSVLPLDHAGWNCWGDHGLSQAEDKNYKGCNEREGNCEWCGKDGMCCRKGWSNNECARDSSHANYHACVGKPGSGFKNEGRKCWNECNKQEGKCDWCGSKGLCCKKGYSKDNTECDGTFGETDHHRCVAKPESFDGFIVGMQSFHFRKYHSGKARWIEDRLYSFLWQQIPDYNLVNCQWTQGFLNGWDEEVNYVLGEDEVFAGVKSEYDWIKHDRKFKVKVCRLQPRCSQLRKITYNLEEASDPVISNMVAGSIKKDNTRHSADGTISVTMSRSSSKSLAQEYSYTRTEGHSMTASLEVSVGVSWGIGVGAEGSTSVTAAFESTWNTEETWTRTNKQEITEENGFKLTYTDVCPAEKYCESKLIMTHGEQDVPYEIVAYTDGKPDDTCSEKGIVTIKSSWGATQQVRSYDSCKCNAEGTENETDCSTYDGSCICKPGWTAYDCGTAVSDHE